MYPMRATLTGAVAAAVLGMSCPAASATPLESHELDRTGLTPVIVAGSPLPPPGEAPDSPANRVDPNTPDSPFTGVVSIAIQRPTADGIGTFICTGSAIGRRSIVTAAHCVDTDDGTGAAVDLHDPDVEVLAVFNNDGSFAEDPAGSIRSVTRIDVHPDYDGFNTCPDGSLGCPNDDIAVLTLDEPIPDGVEIYGFAPSELALDGGTLLTMVGYGTSGTGYLGFDTPPAFDVKRVGFNIADLVQCDDEIDTGGSLFTGSAGCAFFGLGEAEAWYADFDGFDQDLQNIVDAGFSDFFCRELGVCTAAGQPYEDGFIDSLCELFGVCSAQLGNTFEAALGGGDSGGPSFVFDEATENWLLAGNNTFGLQGFGPFGIAGAFGDLFGGVIYDPYVEWIQSKIVPEPGTAALFLGGLGAAFAARRRRRTA
jgi:hypothetical protein